MIYDFEYIPNRWKVLNIEEVGKIVGGGTPSTKNEVYWGGNINWFTPTEITNLSNLYISESKRKITKEGLDNSSAKMIPENSLLFTSRATIGACAINTAPASTNQGFQNIIPNEDISVKYLYYFFSQPLIQERLLRRANGSTFLEVSSSEMKKTKILLPPKLERIKIVCILENLDFLIQTTQRLIEKLQECKKGLMQQLFTKGIGHTEFKETRLGNIPKEWKLLKLKKVVNEGDGLKRGPWGGSVKKEYFVERGYKIYEQKCVIKKDFTLGNYYIDEKKFQELKQFEIRSGDLLMTAAGTLGVIVIVPDKIEPGIFNQAIIRIRLNEAIVHKLFFKYYLQSDFLSKLIKRFTYGSAIKNFASIKILSSVQITIPPMEEQNIIVEILKNIDENIENEKKLKRKLIESKHVLMQALLTGKKRVPI